MRTEILVNKDINQTRIAVLENSELVELWTEREAENRIAGNVYYGIVRTVLPGMQAAFVDIGLQKNGFLHISDTGFGYDDDVKELHSEDDVDFSGEYFPKIEDRLKVNQPVLVQVTREMIGNKGPRLTANLSLAGRYLVLLYNADHIGISRKVSSKVERNRLKKIAESLRPKDFGVIIRTNAEGLSKKLMGKDIDRLSKIWKTIELKSKKNNTPRLLYQDLNITYHFLREMLNRDAQKLILDSKEDCKIIKSYVKKLDIDLEHKIQLYQEETPLFDAFGVEEEIEKIFDPVVKLKSGAYLVIQHTEALTSIDVNTGSYIGKKDPVETILKVNMEAAVEIGRQLRLRDIGGIIIVDFIDMNDDKHKEIVLNKLKGAMSKDKNYSQVFDFTQLGLVEMSRKRVRSNIVISYSETCPKCNGRGRIFSTEFTALKVKRMIDRLGLIYMKKKIMLKINPKVAAYLKKEFYTSIKENMAKYKIDLYITEEKEYDTDKFLFLEIESNEELNDKLS